MAAVADMHAGFLKSFRLKESLQTFARRQQTFLMARLYLVLPACEDNFPAALAKLLYLGGLHSSHLCMAVRCTPALIANSHGVPRLWQRHCRSRPKSEAGSFEPPAGLSELTLGDRPMRISAASHEGEATSPSLNCRAELLL